MATPLIPDTRNHPDPLKVIDPTGVKDSSAALQHLLDATVGTSSANAQIDPEPGAAYRADAGLVSRNPHVTVGSPTNPLRLIAKTDYPWRPMPDKRPGQYQNVDGKCAPWLWDLTGSFKNPYGVDAKGDPISTGSQFGGFDGTTGASGVDYDGLHLSTRTTAPFTQSDKGKHLHVLTYDRDGRDFQRIINFVSADGKTVRWSNANHDTDPAWHEDTSHTVPWATNCQLGWVSTFMPNPAWTPEYFPKANRASHSYQDCLQDCEDKCRGRTMFELRGDHSRAFIEATGSNESFQNAISNYDKSRPVINEFQRNILCSGLQQEISFVSQYSWGDGLDMAGSRHLWVHDYKAQYAGREAVRGSGPLWQARLERGVHGPEHHSAIDWEVPGNQAPIDPAAVFASDWMLLDDVVLTGHGFANNGQHVGHLRFHKVRSLPSDVTAGTIDSTTSPTRGVPWGPGGVMSPMPGYIIWDDCHFDPAFRYDFPFVLHNMTCLWWKNSSGPSVPRSNEAKGGAFVQLVGCTNWKVEGCDGGPLMAAQSDPAAQPPFVPPGDPRATDPWWRAGAPDPQNDWRDQAVAAGKEH